MRLLRPLLVLLALVLLGAGCGGTTGGSPTTVTAAKPGLTSIGEGLSGPAGLTATVFARNLSHVAALAFDPQGRLWAATAEFEDKGNDAVYVIPTPGAEPIKVIDAMHIPLGLLWYGDELYVSSKEIVEAFKGFDGSQFAAARTVVELPADVGENNSITLAPDGRMQLGISAPCDSCVPPLQYSGAIVSFRPEGGDLQVDAKGMRAPIGLAYYPGTDDLFVTMNQRDDLGDKTPGDWLSVVTKGQNWGFPACYGQGGAECAGVPQPVAALDEHAAVSGLAIVTGQLGSKVGNAAIVAEWATGKVQQVALQKDGTTYRGTVAPFLEGVQKPVPVLLAPDGRLFVGDWATGTVYVISSGGGSTPSTS